MKHVKLFENFENSLNEDTTDHFVVNSKTKKILRANGNSRDYWEGSKQGTIDMEIEVFATGDHQAEAKKLYAALKAAGLENSYFSIKIEVKSDDNTYGDTFDDED